jgi:hypothetical protein
MVISHHIATELAAERQRDLRSSSSRRGWRLKFPFGRRKAELEPVPPVVASAGADGPGPAPRIVNGRPDAAPALRVRRVGVRRGGPASSHARDRRRRERAGV